MATNHQETAKRLKKVRTVRYVLSTVGIIIVVLGIWQLVRLLWDYKQNETTNNAQVEQYISPVNVRASGYIRSIRFTEHQFVHKGDTLLLLDDSEYRIRLKEAEANLKITQSSADVTQSALDKTRGNVLVYDANIRETEAKVEMLRKDYGRYSNLLERNATTLIKVEQLKTELDMAVARLEALKKQQHTAELSVAEGVQRKANSNDAIPLAEAKVEQARLSLSYTVVLAPCDGYLGRRSLEEGQYVSAGQTITNIIPNTPKWIIANYKETQIENLYVGQEVTIWIDAIHDRTFHGKVTAISEATGAKYSMVPTDNSAGNFVKIQQRIPVRIEFVDFTEEDNRLLRAGMMAVVSAKIK